MATILIVDDSSLSRKTSRRILEGAGHFVREVSDGMAALEDYALERPDVVLLDVTMTDMNGLQVLQQLCAIDPEVRVVMATADVQSSTRELALAGGAAGFVTKPFDRAAVLGAVAAALEVATE
jgi:two-component system, chemotaxis family, chemotaxis protein CheY